MKHRACRALLCLVLAVSLLLPMTVGALAGSTTIGTDASRPEYFEALGASGNYNPLKTPYHYDKTTGNVAYCLEHKKDSPSSSTEYTDFDASALWGQNTVTLFMVLAAALTAVLLVSVRGIVAAVSLVSVVICLAAYALIRRRERAMETAG